MFSIMLGILLPALDFFVAILLIIKAIKKEWNSFYTTLVMSLLVRLAMILIFVALIVLYLKINLLSFALSLFISLFIFKIIEIFFIIFKSKFVFLQKDRT